MNNFVWGRDTSARAIYGCNSAHLSDPMNELLPREAPGYQNTRLFRVSISVQCWHGIEEIVTKLMESGTRPGGKRRALREAGGAMRLPQLNADCVAATTQILPVRQHPYRQGYFPSLAAFAC
jgi:hypothetical protein